MFHAKCSRLLIAAAVSGLLTPAVVKADEMTMQVTRTTSSDAIPVQSVTTERRTVTTSNVPAGTVIVTNQPASTVVVTGSSIPLTISEAPVILQTVDIRRGVLDKRVVDARTAGTLSEAQAAAMRRELDRIGAEVVFLKGQPNPSLLRSIVVAQDLDVLTTTLRGTVTGITIIPIIEGSHFTVFNGRIVELDDLAVRRIGLENKILSAQAAGKINYDQANHMRSELNAIGAIEDAYKSNGNLTFKNSHEIYKDMDKVANELDNSMH
jgi:hypothetical protein